MLLSFSPVVVIELCCIMCVGLKSAGFDSCHSALIGFFSYAGKEEFAQVEIQKEERMRDE